MIFSYNHLFSCLFELAIKDNLQFIFHKLIAVFSIVPEISTEIGQDQIMHVLAFILQNPNKAQVPPISLLHQSNESFLFDVVVCNVELVDLSPIAFC